MNTIAGKLMEELEDKKSHLEGLPKESCQRKYDTKAIDPEDMPTKSNIILK